MKRDLSIVRLNEQQSLIIASDNSGAIGMKEHDMVKVPYETVAYFSFRVAFMECLAGGGEPASIVVHNFCGDHAWGAIMSGIQRGLQEVERTSLPVTGSTESNFSFIQSALGTIVIGLLDHLKKDGDIRYEEKNFAVIGTPLVGEEVLAEDKQVIPLPLFQQLCRLEGAVILPVGSKGVLFELKNMLNDSKITASDVECEVDILKSGGPSTCILMSFPAKLEPTIKNMTGHLYHSILLC